MPRTTRATAVWGLDELARLLPSAASAGLELHVIYSQDADDLGEGGGDGGPPQVLLSQAPVFQRFQVRGAPQQQPNPTTLTMHLYCDRVAAWNARAGRLISAENARRAAAVSAWARATAAHLRRLANRPIRDTAGSEAGVEIDSDASIFAAAQVAEAAQHSTILFLGGLTQLRPPAVGFRFPARLVGLIRSSNPRPVISAEAAWGAWAVRRGGSFKPLSADDAVGTIGAVLGGS